MQCCAAPSKNIGDFHLLTGRLLMILLQSLLTGVDADNIYNYLSNILPRSGTGTERKGGSNGNAKNFDVKALRRFLHFPGSTSRQSKGVVIVLKGTLCYVFYSQPYERELVHQVLPVWHSCQFWSGQVDKKGDGRCTCRTVCGCSYSC